MQPAAFAYLYQIEVGGTLMNNTTIQNDGQWQAVLDVLKLRATKAQFSHFSGSAAVFDGSIATITIYPPGNAEMCQKLLAGKVSEAIKSATGLSCVARFVAANPKPIILPELDDEPDDDGDTEVVGVYHNSQNAIIKPGKTEWAATQYFRKKWRPLLGPLLSELIRELRQRCHHQSGRNTFKTTYKNLAQCLGVSERTIMRAMAKDDDGKFEKQHLNQFIAATEIIYDRSGDTIKTVGTRYYIYLDEPLTPDDLAELSK